MKLSTVTLILAMLLGVALPRAAFAQDDLPTEILSEKVTPSGQIAQIRIDEEGVCWAVDIDRQREVSFTTSEIECDYLNWVQIAGAEVSVRSYSSGHYLMHAMGELEGNYIVASPDYFFGDALYEFCPDPQYVVVDRFIGPPRLIPEGKQCVYSHDFVGLRHEFSPSEAWMMTFQAFDPTAYDEAAFKLANRVATVNAENMEILELDDMESQELNSFMPMAFLDTPELGPVLLGVDIHTQKLYLLTFTGEYLRVNPVLKAPLPPQT